MHEPCIGKTLAHIHGKLRKAGDLRLNRIVYSFFLVGGNDVGDQSGDFRAVAL